MIRTSPTRNQRGGTEVFQFLAILLGIFYDNTSW